MNNIVWNIKQSSSAMAVSRKLCKNKTYINHNSINGLLLIVYTIALMFPMDGSTFDTESNKIRCSDSMTCAKCTIKPMCVWSLERQVCENDEYHALNTSRLIVSRIKECPQLLVTKKYQYIDNKINVTYTVRITNDVVDFIHYLDMGTDIYYNMPHFNMYKPVRIVNKTDILCSFRLPNKSKTTLTFFWYISLSMIMLRFDNVVDNYDTVYGLEECAIDEKYKSCATCGWNKNGDLNYLKLCSSKNTCKSNKNIYMKNQEKKKVAYVSNNCAEINVTAVDPLCGPKTGGTTVTITVRNHGIFMESGSLKVMVAGALCTDPKTSGPETFTCTTSQSNKTLSGPILVEYSSIENVLKIESSHIFQFSEIEISTELLSKTLDNKSPTHIVDPFNVPVPKYPSILPGSKKTNCSDSMTCIKCTIDPMCVWSFEQQACKNLPQYTTLPLRTFKKLECPRFSVIKEYYYGESNVTLKYIVKVSNYSKFFRNHLNGIILYNRFPTYCKYLTKEFKTNQEMIISCEFYVKKSIFDKNNPSFTFFTFISFNGVMLRFDNISDHYVTFYKQKECANDEKHKACATCAWNDDGYLNYLRLCSSNLTCQVDRNLYMKNNGKEQLNFQLAYLTNDCVEINVAAVDPLSGPETGGTTVMITVRNHRILAENRTVIVTIAGTMCLNSRTSGLETITCTTSQSVGTPSGPILVEYSSTENVLKIESSQIFQFCPNPVLDVDQQLHGIASGGNSVPVHGGHFVEHSITFLARLYVDLPDGVRRYADSNCDPPVNDTYMVCRSPRVNGVGGDGYSSVVKRSLNFGLDITFSKDVFSVNQMLPIAVRGPLLRYYVQPDPVLLDFEIDKSGSVTITGDNLQHVRPEDIVIRFVDSQHSCCVVVLVTRHSLVCETTMSVIEPQVISITLGNSLVFTLLRRWSTPPDNPSVFRGWFFLIMSTVLLFVGAFTCRLKMKHRYNRIETRSQDLEVHTAL
ncbi:uncharacterized protein LOC111034181 [Myzus persicae]|uniref:uncharacterized protein LOC111034181 n=1 Tax=Myzus persicae TaxID=13164 RepID=UPI000B932E5F|nr:uncharacterized protein LOC111034181 [Myzus persicae]